MVIKLYEVGGDIYFPLKTLSRSLWGLRLCLNDYLGTQES